MKLLITIILLFITLNAEAVNFCTDGNTSGAWKLDETSGNYTDCTSNANTGVITGTINQSDTLKYGNAAGFTAVNNTNIDVGSNAVLDNVFDGGGTFAAWVGLDGAGTAGTLCDGGTIAAKGDADGWTLCINATGSVSFWSKWAGGFVEWESNTSPFSAFNGTAKHIMVYYNSDSTTNDPTVKIDCSDLTMVEGGTAPFGTRNTDAAINMTIGLDGNTTNSGELNGTLDEVILYNGDLTSVCSTLSTSGIDGTQGSGGSGGEGATSGKQLNGVTFNAFTF